MEKQSSMKSTTIAISMVIGQMNAKKNSNFKANESNEKHKIEGKCHK